MKSDTWGWSREFDTGIPELQGTAIWFGDLVVLTAKMEDRSPVGILDLDLRRGYIERGFVTESWRRKGVMTALINEAMVIARESGLDRVSGTTDISNAAVRSMSESLGFSELIYLEKRIDNLVFWKNENQFEDSE